MIPELVKPLCFSNMYTIRQVQTPSQPLVLTSQRRKFRLMDRLSPFKFGIQQVKKSSNHLVSHSTEVLTAVLYALILPIPRALMHLISGRRDSLRMLVQMIPRLSHLSSLETRSIEKARGKWLLPRLKHGARRIMICCISRLPLRKVSL